MAADKVNDDLRVVLSSGDTAGHLFMVNGQGFVDWMTVLSELVEVSYAFVQLELVFVFVQSLTVTESLSSLVRFT